MRTVNTWFHMRHRTHNVYTNKTADFIFKHVSYGEVRFRIPKFYIIPVGYENAENIHSAIQKVLKPHG